MDDNSDYFETEDEIDNCYDECEGCIVRMETGSESEFEESEFEDAVAS